jgi:hypothetical protein
VREESERERNEGSLESSGWREWRAERGTGKRGGRLSTRRRQPWCEAGRRSKCLEQQKELV